VSTLDVDFSGWMQSQITGGGHGIAAARMGGMLNVAGWVNEQMGGLRCFLSTALPSTPQATCTVFFILFSSVGDLLLV
jgi:hypothetical protein